MCYQCCAPNFIKNSLKLNEYKKPSYDHMWKARDYFLLFSKSFSAPFSDFPRQTPFTLIYESNEDLLHESGSGLRVTEKAHSSHYNIKVSEDSDEEDDYSS